MSTKHRRGYEIHLKAGFPTNPGMTECDQEDALLIDVEGDGNCLPRSLAIALCESDGIYELQRAHDNHLKVRDDMGMRINDFYCVGLSYCKFPFS
jgi:hypothetical protein